MSFRTAEKVLVCFLFFAFCIPVFSEDGDEAGRILSLKEIDALIKKTSYDEALLELKKYGEANPIQFDAVQSRIKRIIRRRDDYTKNAVELADVISSAEEGTDNSESLERLAHKLLVNEMDPDDRNLDKIKDVHKLAARSQFKAVQNKTSTLVAEGKYTAALDKSTQTFQTFREYFDDHYMDSKIQKDADLWISSVQSLIQQWKDKGFQDRLKIAYDNFMAAVQNRNVNGANEALVTLKTEFTRYANLRNSILKEGLKFKIAYMNKGTEKDEDFNQFLRYASETVLSAGDNPNCGIVGVLDARWNNYIESMKDQVLLSIDGPAKDFALSENVANFSPESHVVPDSSALVYLYSMAEVGKKVNALYSTLVDVKSEGEKPMVPFENYDLSLTYIGNMSSNAEKLISSLSVVNDLYNAADGYPVPQSAESNDFEKSEYVSKIIPYTKEIETGGKSINIKATDSLEWKRSYDLSISEKKSGRKFDHKMAGRTIVDVPVEWEELSLSFRKIDEVASNYSQDLSALLWKKIARYFADSGDQYVSLAETKKNKIENLVTGISDGAGKATDSASAEDLEVTEEAKRHPGKALEEVRIFNSDLNKALKILVSAKSGVEKGNPAKSADELTRIQQNMANLNKLLKDVSQGPYVAQANSLIRKSLEARDDAESLLKQAGNELKKDNFSKAYEALSEAGLKIRAALENDSDVKFSDGSSVSFDVIGALEKQIAARAEEVVTSYVMEQKQKANREIDVGNYEVAVDCLTNAKNRLAQAKLPEDPDLKRLLDFVEKANSMEEGRKLNLYDPLYKEMSGILSDATLCFEEGKKLVSLGNKNKDESSKSRGMEKLMEAGKRVDDLLLVYPLNQEASFLKLRIEQYENPSEFESSFANRVEKTKKEFSKAENNEAATDAYYNLANLAKLKPDDKKLAKFIYDAEIKIGKRRPEVKNTNITSAKKRYDSAAKLFAQAGNDINRLNKALSEADEALKLNPINGDAKLYKDSYALYNRIRKQINVVRPRELTANDRASYYKAYDLASERQYARALRIIEPLHEKYPDNADISELYENLKGRV